MPDSDLCYFFFGFLVAGVLGRILQRLLLLRFRARRADRRIAEVITEQSAREIYMASRRARREIAAWIVLLIAVVAVVVWFWLA